MKYDKRWLSIDDQIDLLKSKGLIFGNLDEAKRFLTAIGYYRLSAYWFPYKTIDESGRTIFCKGASFEMVMRDYEFDRKLRLLMFEALGKIEIFLRSRVAYYAAEESGLFGYPEAVAKRLEREYNQARRSEQHAKHFDLKYGDKHDLPPYWLMVECATMGTIELLFAHVSPNLRSKIAAELEVKVPVLKNWLSVLRVARNACCHHSRVWNRIWGVRPMIPKSWKGFTVSNSKTFAVLSILYYMLEKIDDAQAWREKLERLLDVYGNVRLSKVGFPTDWNHSQPWV